MANDPKTFAEGYCRAVHDWAAAHPDVTLQDIADALDEAPDRETIAQFLADPEQRIRTGRLKIP